LSFDIGNAADGDRANRPVTPIVEQERVERQDGMFRRREVAAEVRTRPQKRGSAVDACDVAPHFGADRNHDAIVRVDRFDHQARHDLSDAFSDTLVECHAQRSSR
jgi:hypothetical protein